MIKKNLKFQLMFISFVSIIITYISLGILLPKVLTPIYEKNIYMYLKQPLDLIDERIGEDAKNDDIAYLYMTKNLDLFVSNNFRNIIDMDTDKLIDIIKKNKLNFGNFNYKNKKYYYHLKYNGEILSLTLSDNRSIVQLKKDVLKNGFPIILMTVLVVSALTTLWSRSVVTKINNLKSRIKDYNLVSHEQKKYLMHDEFAELNQELDNLLLYIKKEEEFKNKMYQNISHDLKTPITVINSHLEAYTDGVVDKEKAIKVIKNQTLKLEQKIKALLYLNKLEYIKESKNDIVETVDVIPILEESIEKFKLARKDVDWKFINKNKKLYLRGNSMLWEVIFDNLLENFIRYAESKIEIRIKNKKIYFFNDGEKIDENFIKSIYTPYKKSLKGQFGLGLSIIKESLNLYNYKVVAENLEKGVMFTISEKKDKV